MFCLSITHVDEDMVFRYCLLSVYCARGVEHVSKVMDVLKCTAFQTLNHLEMDIVQCKGMLIQHKLSPLLVFIQNDCK